MSITRLQTQDTIADLVSEATARLPVALAASFAVTVMDPSALVEHNVPGDHRLYLGTLDVDTDTDFTTRIDLPCGPIRAESTVTSLITTVIRHVSNLLLQEVSLGRRLPADKSISILAGPTFQAVLLGNVVELHGWVRMLVRTVPLPPH